LFSVFCCGRWYLRYALSYGDVAEMMQERGLSTAHTTIYRWVQVYAPEIDKRCRPQLKPTNDSWRVDEIYIKVRGKWMVLYRALDSVGNTLDFLLNATRSRRAAKRSFRKVLGGKHVKAPRVINVAKNPVYSGTVRDRKGAKVLSADCERRPIQSMEQPRRTRQSLPETPSVAGSALRLLPEVLANARRV
jgi:transposase, IS6 family